MNSYADKTDTGKSNAVANSFSEQQQERRSGKHAFAQFHAPGVLQRYTIVQPDHIKAQAGATVETQDIERTQYGSTYIRKSNVVNQTGFDPTTTETTTERVSGTQRPPQVSSLPSFKVSKNGFMAIPAEGQAKNFYGNEEKIQQANQVFIANDAPIRLETQGAGITVPKFPEHPTQGKTRNLKKVHAASKVLDGENQEIGKQIEQALPEVECNAFIKLITGASGQATRVAVLENKLEEEHVELKSIEGGEPVNQIGTLIGEQSQLPSHVEDRLKNRPPDDNEQISGKKDYESLSPQKRSKRAKRLGVNEHVNPQVGEGMVIRSLETTAKLESDGRPIIGPHLLPKDEKNSKNKRRKLRDGYLESLNELDHANALLSKSRLGVSLGVQGMMNTWGQHYAGVVGRDGPDMVTLENYNRATEIEWEHERIFNNLFRDFFEFSALVTSKVDSLNKVPDKKLIQQLVTLAAQAPNLHHTYRAALQEAINSFQTGITLNQETYNGNFYFDMYGPGSQSFHSRFSGSTGNPVTLHIKESPERTQQEALDSIQLFQQVIAKWEGPVLSNPVFPVQNTLLALVAQAHVAEQKAINDNATAQTRGEFSKVISDVSAASSTFTSSIRPTVASAYKIITSKNAEPQVYNPTEVRDRCNEVLSTYSWYDFGDYVYVNITDLRNLCEALIAKGII
jgi:hypothetical protein